MIKLINLCRYATIADVLLRFFDHFNYTTPYFMDDQTITLFQQMGTLIETTIRQRNPDLYYASKFIKFESATLTRKSIEVLLLNGSDSSRGNY